jgi:hypothetical protein
MNSNEYENLLKDGTLQKSYFQILKDGEWHCRDCAARETGSTQIAGGGGTQGLERGTKNRPGIVIESEQRFCKKCKKPTIWERWSGEFKSSNAASALPKKLQKLILSHYNYTDSIEERKRPANELVIDHRFPMERWGSVEEKNPSSMEADAIEKKFQLLKKDSSGNHNLLKSRACESCIKTGKRGYPMGIKFYYEGNEDWPSDCPREGADAERGCIGCGWYNYKAWRSALNDELKKDNEK